MDRTIPILLIEDDPIDAMTVRRAFSAAQITNPLHTASDPREALVPCQL